MPATRPAENTAAYEAVHDRPEIPRAAREIEASAVAQATEQLENFETQAVAAAAEAGSVLPRLDAPDAEETTLVIRFGELKENKKSLVEGFMTKMKGLKERIKNAVLDTKVAAPNRAEQAPPKVSLSAEEMTKLEAAQQQYREKINTDQLRARAAEENKQIDIAVQKAKTEQALDNPDYDRAMAETNLKVLAEEMKRAEASGDTQLKAILQQEQAKEMTKFKTASERTSQQKSVDAAYTRQMDSKEPQLLPSLEESRQAFVNHMLGQNNLERATYVGKARRELAQSFNRPDLAAGRMTTFKEQMADLIYRLPLGAERTAREEKFEMMQRVFSPRLEVVRPNERMNNEESDAILQRAMERLADSTTSEDHDVILESAERRAGAVALKEMKGAWADDDGALLKRTGIRAPRPESYSPFDLSEPSEILSAPEGEPSTNAIKVEQMPPVEQRKDRVAELSAKLDAALETLYDPSTPQQKKEFAEDDIMKARAELTILKPSQDELKPEIRLKWKTEIKLLPKRRAEAETAIKAYDKAIAASVKEQRALGQIIYNPTTSTEQKAALDAQRLALREEQMNDVYARNARETDLNSATAKTDFYNSLLKNTPKTRNQTSVPA